MCATSSSRRSLSSKTISSGRSLSGTTIQYDATPKASYAAFLLFRSISAVLGERTSTASNGGSVTLAPPTSQRRTTTMSGSNSVSREIWTAGSGSARRPRGHACLSTTSSSAATS